MGRNFVDVSRVPLKQFTSEKSHILLIKKFFFFLVKFIDDITGGKCADGEGEGGSVLPYIACTGMLIYLKVLQP